MIKRLYERIKQFILYKKVRKYVTELRSVDVGYVKITIEFTTGLSDTLTIFGTKHAPATAKMQELLSEYKYEETWIKSDSQVYYNPSIHRLSKVQLLEKGSYHKKEKFYRTDYERIARFSRKKSTD